MIRYSCSFSKCLQHLLIVHKVSPPVYQTVLQPPSGRTERHYFTSQWGRRWRTSPRGRTLCVLNGIGHIAALSHDPDPSQTPPSGAESCRAPSPTEHHCATPAQEADHSWVCTSCSQFISDMNESHLDRNVCVGVSPVEDSSEVELRVSLRFKDTWPHSVALTADHSVSIWSCAAKNTKR